MGAGQREARARPSMERKTPMCGGSDKKAGPRDAARGLKARGPEPHTDEGPAGLGLAGRQRPSQKGPAAERPGLLRGARCALHPSLGPSPVRQLLPTSMALGDTDPGMHPGPASSGPAHHGPGEGGDHGHGTAAPGLRRSKRGLQCRPPASAPTPSAGGTQVSPVTWSRHKHWLQCL